MKKRKDKYILKSSHSPVSGMNTYSVFKDDKLVFMIDGERPSIFVQDEVETVPVPCGRFYRVADWLFTGCTELSSEVIRQLPGKCMVITAMGEQFKH